MLNSAEHERSFITLGQDLVDPNQLSQMEGVVWCGEGVMYLMSPGRQTDICLQLGKACYPCSR